MSKKFNSILFILLIVSVIYGQFFASGTTKNVIDGFWKLILLVIIGSSVYQGTKKELKKPSKK